MLCRLRMLGLVGFAAMLLASSCGSAGSAGNDGPSGLDASRPSTTILLPDKTEITAEIAASPKEQAQGMMFRRNLRAGEGMLFPFEEMAPRAFWMFQCVISLDIIWLDDNKRIVEISARTPPCRSDDASSCPTYGGKADSTYVLEIASGQAAAHNLVVGDQLRF